MIRRIPLLSAKKKKKKLNHDLSKGGDNAMI